MQVRVVTHPRWLSVCNIPDPQTGLQAKFSYAQVLAMRLLGHDTARLETYCDALCADPEVVALRRRVDVTGDEDVPETASRVTIILKDGTHRQATHDLTQPMPLDARRTKVLAKAESLLGVSRIAVLSGLVDGDAAPQTLGAALV
jgi:2-methylcitrate dehydratase PrpD